MKKCATEQINYHQKNMYDPQTCIYKIHCEHQQTTNVHVNLQYLKWLTKQLNLIRGYGDFASLGSFRFSGDNFVNALLLFGGFCNLAGVRKSGDHKLFLVIIICSGAHLLICSVINIYLVDYSLFLMIMYFFWCSLVNWFGDQNVFSFCSHDDLFSGDNLFVRVFCCIGDRFFSGDRKMMFPS